MKLDTELEERTEKHTRDEYVRENIARPLLRNVHSTKQLRRLSRLYCWRDVSYLQKLTREFFRTEMRRDFLTESLFFVTIIVFSVWPMILLVERMAKTFP